MAVKYNRKENAIKGSITGVLYQFVNLLLPFVLRTVFVYTLGIEYTGLNSLFSSIISVLNLAELGVGSALIFSMYKPISENNTEKICALMQLYKVYYRIIGGVVLAIGVVITPILPVLIHGSLPEGINLYVLYAINLLATVFSYWLFAYKNSILSAFQKNYVINLIALLVSVVQYAFQFLVLIIFKDYYLYLIVNLAFQLVKNVVTAIVANRMYPQYHAYGVISKTEKKDINRKVSLLFAAKVCGVVTNSADTIVLSSFLGLTVLGVYNNYYYILNAIMMTFNVFYNSLRAGIGNSLITETKEKNIKDFNNLTYMLSLLVCICFSCLLNLYQPFIRLWMGKDKMLGFSSVILLCLYFMFYEYPIFWAIYKDAAGKWKEDLVRSIVTPIFNLTINIFLVGSIGVNGVLISTVVTYGIISGPWLLINIKRYVLDFQLLQYVKKMVLYVCCILGCGLLSHFLCEFISMQGIAKILMNLVISIVVPFSIFLLVFRKSEDSKYGNAMLSNILKKYITNIIHYK